MPIAINGSGTVTGISVGGLPDGIVDTDMLAAGAVTAHKRGAGAILQVVQTFKNDSFSTTSTSYVDITGFSVTITPSSTSNKILLLNFAGLSTDGNSSVQYINLLRGSTAIAQPSVSTGFSSTATMFPQSISNMISWSYSFLDSPSTTSATTYKWQIKGYTGTQYINQRAINDMPRTATMIAMEVAG